MEYTLRPDISVQYVFQNGFDLHLRPRLTTAARSELHSQLFALAQVHLTMNAPDQRLLVSTSAKFKVRDAYKLLTYTGMKTRIALVFGVQRFPTK